MTCPSPAGFVCGRIPYRCSQLYPTVICSPLSSSGPNGTTTLGMIERRFAITNPRPALKVLPSRLREETGRPADAVVAKSRPVVGITLSRGVFAVERKNMLIGESNQSLGPDEHKPSTIHA